MQVDKLIAQREAMQAEADTARKAQAQAEATVEAIKRQAGGLSKEYDRVVEVCGNRCRWTHAWDECQTIPKRKQHP